MLLIDSRVGSKDLVEPLKNLGLPVLLTELESADIAFEGRGPQETSLLIGIELKRLDGKSTDLIQSLRSGRLSGEQLPKMLGPHGQYEYGWLLVEGEWRTDKQGQLTVYKGPKIGWVRPPGKMSTSELEKKILTLELCGGLHVHHARSRAETLKFLANLYRWFTDRDFDQHTSHLMVHTPQATLQISDFRKAVCQWPGIGVKTSKAVEQRFHTIRCAAAAPVEEWAAITTGDRKLGHKTAARVVKFLRGE